MQRKCQGYYGRGYINPSGCRVHLSQIYIVSHNINGHEMLCIVGNLFGNSEKISVKHLTRPSKIKQERGDEGNGLMKWGCWLVRAVKEIKQLECDGIKEKGYGVKNIPGILYPVPRLEWIYTTEVKMVKSIHGKLNKDVHNILRPTGWCLVPAWLAYEMEWGISDLCPFQKLNGKGNCYGIKSQIC